MKRSLFYVVFFILCAAALWAGENPFIGKWQVEIIGVPEVFEFEFFDNSRINVTGDNGGSEERKYQINLGANEIYLDLENELESVWVYHFPTEDEFYLYVRDRNSVLIQELTREFEDAKAQSINWITDDFWNILVDKIAEAVLESPMARGFRVSEI